MKVFLVVFAVVAGLVVFSQIRRKYLQFKVALNALMAKHTFLQMDDDTRSAVDFRSWQVLQKMGFSDPVDSLKRMNELERCSTYAFAMAEMEISPPFEKEVWQYVARPFMLLIGAQTAIRAAQNHLAQTYNVRVEIESG